jgi:hypothetical protein
MTKRTLTISFVLAFIAGALLALVLTWGWTETLRVRAAELERQNLLLSRDLNNAVQRGIWVEAHWKQCLEGDK